MLELLSERSKNILRAAVSEYISVGEPVGSRTISKKYNVDLSPASIRNVMADLEEMEFLYQPHTSAGRIPTDKGLRYFVDYIIELRKLTKHEKERIDCRYQPLNFEIIDIMKETSSLLSTFSRCAGLVLSPKFDNVILKHIEFLKLKKNQILTIFVSNAGIVHNKIIEIEEELTQDQLYKFTRYLNELLTDLNLEEVREKIVNEMKKEKNMYDWMMSRALKLSEEIFRSSIEDVIYIDGTFNVFECPEFCDVEKMKTIFRAFEEKSILIKLLDQAMEGDGIQIFIGAENQFEEVHECSIVASPYTCKNSTVGTLGVIGPIRMNYFDIIPIVEYTAKAVSKLMDAGC